VIRVEQLSVSNLMPKEVQFAEISARQNDLNQFDVANSPIHFVLVVSGVC